MAYRVCRSQQLIDATDPSYPNAHNTHAPRVEQFELLKEVPLFKKWEHYRLYRLAFSVEQLNVSAGHPITRQGETTQRLVIITEGTARIDVEAQDGETHTVATLQQGEYVGESGLIMHARGSKDVEPVVEPATVLALTNVATLVIPKSSFKMLDSK